MDSLKEWNSHPMTDFEGRDTPTPNEEIRELARLIYAEAGGTDEQTKAMVGLSVRNRVNKRGYPDTYTGVIHEKKNGKKQYKAVGGDRWNKAADLDKLNPKEYNDYRLAYDVAKGVYAGAIPDRSGVEFFMSGDLEDAPFFKDALKGGRIRQIGPPRDGITFFKDNSR